MELWIYILLGIILILATAVGIALLISGGKSKRDGQTDEQFSVREERDSQTEDEAALLELKRKRGIEGELSVKALLGETVPSKRYVINGITANGADGSSFDIDHVYINKYGIWIIETKNYSGEVVGTEQDGQWAYTLDNRTVARYNPVKQNQTHIYRLKRLLNEDRKIFWNLVVFVGKGTVHVASDKVCYLNELQLKLNTPTNTVLTVDEMERYYSKILNLKEYAISNKEHIKKLNEKQTNFCPRCGTELIKIYNEEGTYLTCPNSMRCSYKRKIDDGWRDRR
ncbi:MAG: NERD domain-containing protein [Firmicutes bacterium]|nr:NERD domain-containing protein [Bacillota bacterium]